MRMFSFQTLRRKKNSNSKPLTLDNRRRIILRDNLLLVIDVSVSLVNRMVTLYTLPSFDLYIISVSLLFSCMDSVVLCSVFTSSDRNYKDKELLLNYSLSMKNRQSCLKYVGEFYTALCTSTRSGIHSRVMS